MIPKKCPNIERNLETCPCTCTDCPRRGFCCECIRYHRAQGELTACQEKAGLRLPETVPVESDAEPGQAEPFRLLNFAECAG